MTPTCFSSLPMSVFIFDTCCIAGVTMGTKKGWGPITVKSLLDDFSCYGDCIIAAVLPGKVAVLKVLLLKLPIG